MSARPSFLPAAGLLAGLLVVALGARAAADRVGAEGHYGLAQKSREKGEPEAAEASLRKAIAEDETFLPAHLALGEVLLARGSVQEGLVELRTAGTLAADAAAASAWPADVARTKKRLQELEATTAAITAKVGKHVADLLALAGRWAEKDPDLARTTLQRVLRLSPDHAEATERLVVLDPKPKGEVTALFQSVEGTNSFGMLDGWRVQGGNVSATGVQTGAGVWMLKEVSGDYDLRAEARLVKAVTQPVSMALTVIHAVGDISSFGFREGQVRWEELTPAYTKSVWERAPSALGYDPHAWTPIEMRFRGDKAEGWINGKRVAEVERRNPNGKVMVGLRFQSAQVEFRRTEIFVPEAR